MTQQTLREQFPVKTDVPTTISANLHALLVRLWGGATYRVDANNPSFGERLPSPEVRKVYYDARALKVQLLSKDPEAKAIPRFMLIKGSADDGLLIGIGHFDIYVIAVWDHNGCDIGKLPYQIKS